VAAKLARIRKLTDLPLGVGFGIKDADSAQAVAQLGDAVIVGSALVSRIENLIDQPDAIPAEVARLLASMREAMDLI
jgi:tryptophan synthase alpha chain